MKKRILFLVFLGVIFCLSSAQEQTEVMIDAKIVDQVTKEPLIYASVFFKNRTDTISNQEGEFRLLSGSPSDSIKISYVGYETLSLAVSSLPKVIELKPMNYLLDEVVIASLNANKIIRQFLKKHKKTYLKKKPQNSFFYRQVTLTDTVCTEILEAFFQAYSNYRVNDLKLVTGRYAKSLSDSNEPLTTFRNYFYISQVTPINYEPPQKNVIIVPLCDYYARYYKASIEMMYDSQGRSLYKIHFNPNPEIKTSILKGVAYLNAADLSLEKFEGELLNVPIHSKGFQSEARNNLTTFQVNYKQDEGISVVESINIYTNYDVTYMDEDLSPINVQINSILYNIGSLKAKQKKTLKYNTFLLEEISKSEYDPAFWEENVIIKRTPLEEKATNDFEKENLFKSY